MAPPGAGRDLKPGMNNPAPSYDPYPPGDFDAWAQDYDAETAAEAGFPFTGYSRIIQTVIDLSEPFVGAQVLDLGTGTGILAGRLADLGCTVLGVDYSPGMLAVARRKYPLLTFIQADLRSEWLREFERSYDRIVSAYTFLHFELASKVALVSRLIERALAPAGWLVIADISFENFEAMEEVRHASGERWEEEEYWSAAVALPALVQVGLQADYRQVSNCAGVYRIRRGE